LIKIQIFDLKTPYHFLFSKDGSTLRFVQNLHTTYFEIKSYRRLPTKGVGRKFSMGGRATEKLSCFLVFDANRHFNTNGWKFTTQHSSKELERRFALIIQSSILIKLMKLDH